MLDLALLISVPVGISWIGFVIGYEMKQAKIARISQKLRKCGHVQIQIGKGGKWII